MGLFSRDKKSKAQKAYESKMKEAMDAQRSGDIQKFAQLSDEANQMLLEMREKETAK